MYSGQWNGVEVAVKKFKRTNARQTELLEHEVNLMMCRHHTHARGSGSRQLATDTHVGAGM